MKKRSAAINNGFYYAFLAAVFAVSLLLQCFISGINPVPSMAASAEKANPVNAGPAVVNNFFVNPSDMKVNFDFQNANVVDVIRMIARVSGMNVLIGSGVSGKVTMKMHGVPLKNVLSVILEAYGLGMVKNHGIYYINSSSNISSAIVAEEKAKAVSEHKITRIVPVNYVSASDLVDKIKPVLSAAGHVLYDKSLHALLISDIPAKVDEAEKLVKMLDKKTPQVEIVAKMVEVDSGYSREFGINWNAGYLAPAPQSSNAAVTPNYFGAQTTGNPTGPGLSPSLTTQPGAGTFSVGILNSYASINATLQALESLSKAKSIASPKIIVLNNQKATIEKGQTLYLPSAAGVGTSAAPQAVTAQLSLEITPHVMSNGEVKLNINSSNNSVAPAAPTGTQSEATLDTESANSIVIVKNGQTVVLGGVYETNKIVGNNGVPLLMNIPLLGWLFKYETVTYSRDELLIFITPKVVKG